ncbi:MAG TPA: hypothetical protein VFU21_27985, partial [Kofleriaceae bacterium]|nr:hypothetical protein [Kofleriaceae bacterium]
MQVLPLHALPFEQHSGCGRVQGSLNDSLLLPHDPLLQVNSVRVHEREPFMAQSPKEHWPHVVWVSAHMLPSVSREQL